MTIAEKIYQQAEQLPAPLQMTVLEFVEYLVTKLRSKPNVEEDEDAVWSQFSLQMALRGMEDEESDDYQLTDIKEFFVENRCHDSR
jgi:hypothetical protein